MQAMQPLVGFNKGAGNYARVRAILVRVLVTSVAMGGLFSLLVVLFPHAIASLFSKDDAELVRWVQQGLPWFVIPVTLFGLSGTMSHYFLSIHEPKKAGVLLLGRQLLAIPLFLVLPRWFGINGMYYVAPCADLPFALVATGFIVKELRALSARIEAGHRALPATELVAGSAPEAT
jgi:Na+-driven multidrug efflux pump